ncbi:MAG: nitrate ABC transporter substrate-binding protein, partial [Sphingobacteriales bacterium]
MKKRFYKLSKITALSVLLLASFASVSLAQGKKIKLGFIPLTDCAPLVVAKELGLFTKYGVDVELSKESSWANIRDKVLNGELDGAHCLYSMPFSVYTGIGGKPGSEMKIAMTLNNNGQGITLSKDFCGLVGFKEVNKVAAAVKKVEARKEVTFAMTFPGGTHDIWLRYWMAAAGINPKSV